jgi:hypothetical protein
MNTLKIALAQIDYRPAFILESHELLVEPIFTSMKEPHTSISLLSFNGSEKVSNSLREKYISWMRIKIIAIIEKCIDLSVDLVVFPEYSIPIQLLSDICSLTRDKKIRVIAGTHIVTNVAHSLPDGYPNPKNYLRCAMSPIIADGKIENFTCKKILAAEEHNNIKVPKDDVADSFVLNNYNLNVKICIEAIADQETLQACEKSILAVPSLSRNIEPFRALQILAKYKEIPIIYVNGASYGGSVISGPYALDGKHWFVENNSSKPVPKNCEALVTSTINLDAIRHSVGTVLLPPAITLNEVLPILYKENEADNKLMLLIDQCKKDQALTPLCEVVSVNSSILREIIKKLRLDEKQGILDCETLTENLNYLKVNSFNFSQMTLRQVKEAVSMLAKRSELGFADTYYGTTQEQLFAFLNKNKNSSGIENQDFSNDKGLFRGRDLEKNALSRFFDDPKQSVVCINGLRGIGKTKLVNSIENEILPIDSAWSIKQIRFTIGVGYDYIISKLSYDLNLTYIEKNGKSASDVAALFAKQIKKYSPIIIILDDFHYCLNTNGYFTDLRIKDFIINLIREIQGDEGIKILFTSNRRIREPLQEVLNTIEVSKLDNDTIESIISYCYKKITKNTSAPKIKENVVKSAYGNPLAAILIAQLVAQKGTANIETYENEFKRYQEGLIKNLIEEIEFTPDENELMKIAAVSKGEINVKFIEKYFPQLFYCIATLSNRLIIENSLNKLSLHPLFREVFYSDMTIMERSDIHIKYSQYFEEVNEEHNVKLDPSNLSNLIYHLGGSLQINKLGKYKLRFIDELKPIADQLYKDKNYSSALKFYLMIYDTLGKVRYDILLRIAICYINSDNYDIRKSEDFFKQATQENPKAAFIWAEYSIALSNVRKHISMAIDYAKTAERICNANEHPLPWEKAKIKFAFAKAYRYDNHVKAKDFCKEACDLDDTNVYYICTYADMLIRINDYDGAGKWLEKAEILQPHDKFLIRIKEKFTTRKEFLQDDSDNQENFEDENIDQEY